MLKYTQEDSNLHDLSVTASSRLRVYQFHHGCILVGARGFEPRKSETTVLQTVRFEPLAYTPILTQDSALGRDRLQRVNIPCAYRRVLAVVSG